MQNPLLIPSGNGPDELTVVDELRNLRLPAPPPPDTINYDENTGLFTGSVYYFVPGYDQRDERCYVVEFMDFKIQGSFLPPFFYRKPVITNGLDPRDLCEYHEEWEGDPREGYILLGAIYRPVLKFPHHMHLPGNAIVCAVNNPVLVDGEMENNWETRFFPIGSIEFLG